MRYRKLVDVKRCCWTYSGELQTQLDRHQVSFKISYPGDFETSPDGFRRFMVQSSDLCIARTIVSALDHQGMER